MKSPDIKTIWSNIWCTCDMHKKHIRKPHEHARVHRHACRTSANISKYQLSLESNGFLSLLKILKEQWPNATPKVWNGKWKSRHKYSFASYVQTKRSHQKDFQGMLFLGTMLHTLDHHIYLSYIYLQNAGITWKNNTNSDSWPPQSVQQKLPSP